MDRDPTMSRPLYNRIPHSLNFFPRPTKLILYPKPKQPNVHFSHEGPFNKLCKPLDDRDLPVGEVQVVPCFYGSIVF